MGPLPSLLLPALLLLLQLQALLLLLQLAAQLRALELAHPRARDGGRLSHAPGWGRATHGYVNYNF